MNQPTHLARSATHVSSIVFTTLLLIGLLATFASSSLAESNTATYNIGKSISDGKSGRVWGSWKQAIPNRGVRTVRVKLRKQSGGNDTYVNLRFEGGNAFENGKRVQVSNTASREVSWTVNEAANGKSLVLNAYNGEVFVESARVEFAPQSRPDPEPPRADSGSSQNNTESVAVDNEMFERCRRARIKRPRIEVGSIKPSGGVFSGKYRLQGSIFGACIEEAGYFERGQLKEEFKFPLSDRFKREEFNIKVRTGRNGQIRAYTTTGREAVFDVDDQVKEQGLL